MQYAVLAQRPDRGGGVSCTQHGFGVRLAADGREAAELYRKHRPDIGLVLLDTRLGDPETLAALRDVDPQVRSCLLDRDAEAAQALRDLMRRG
jgi:hypothetical protein